MIATGHPLSDLLVLDASRVLAGPFCGQVLGDLGADVIKVERPGSGDETRAWGPPFLNDLSAYFLSCNRNKKGITLNLSKEKGRSVFHQLVEKSDILLENFRPDSAEKLGLSPGQLMKINPRLIICSISGYGRTGPMADAPGYDVAIQARSGLMSITGPVAGPPSKVGVAVTDVLTGLYGAIAVLAAVHARKSSGHGYAIDLALLDCAVASQVNVAQAFLISGKVPERQGNAHLQIVPYQLFQTADTWLILAIGNDGQFQRFCQAAGADHLAEDARYTTNPSRVEHRETLIPTMEAILRQKTTEQWISILEPANVPHAPVQTYADVFSHPQAKDRGLQITVTDPQGRPVDLMGSPFHIDGADLPTATCPPTLSQHTREVLGDLLGYSEEEIEGLRQDEVV